MCRLVRNILADKPRVTKFPIDWEGSGQQKAGGAEGEQPAENEMQVDG